MKKYFTVASLILVALTSCVSNKKANSLQKQLEEQKSEQVSLLQKLDSIDARRISKRNSGELDEMTDSATYQYIRQLRDSIQIRIQQYDAIASNGYKNKRRNRKAQEHFSHVSMLYKADLENVLFFDELLAANTFAKLNTAVFFGSGQYKIESNTEAEKMLGTVTDEVLRFAAKHSDRELHASFIVLGYADEENFTPGSELYKDLTKNMSSPSPGRIQLNVEMSNRRANAITSILREQYRLQRSSFPVNNLSDSFFSIGKGEQLPAGKITDYKPVDERRRVVLIYWSVLPKRK
ncbi:OmpA family protein [Pinibacter aurantiacus]|uniref:OmpA-like domain-containing protein n=1 Tax=Pinibacter aurantiacus TaxID=2851599 RepID=A0A9E2SED9_9BACT|nr:hypothetical protein [Pinibacter aurantiacus]MBV4359534.1 hypothetical protein [Pinibacter aurantiacus]